MSSTNAIWTTLMSMPLFAALLERLRQIPISRARVSLLVLIIIWLLVILSDMVWMLVPKPELRPLEPINSAPMLVKSQSDSGSNSFTMIDVNTMKSWNLFGALDAELIDSVVGVPDEADLDAKETRLSLKLLGVMQSSNASRGHAIIQHQSQSELYTVGDAIPVSRGVSLSKVLVDRVIIDNAGNFESLFLWDEEGQRVIKPQPVAKPTKKIKGRSSLMDKRSDAKLTKIASGYKQRLINDPMSMAEVMRFSPAKNADGSMQGYRVSPGRDRANFKAFGLKSGDIITAVNGVELSDQANAMRVYQDLSSATEASFDILRQGEAVNLIVSLE